MSTLLTSFDKMMKLVITGDRQDANTIRPVVPVVDSDPLFTLLSESF